MNKKNQLYLPLPDRIKVVGHPSIPEESEGPCKRCKRIKLLGDGYCSNCWDKTTGAARSYEKLD